MQFLVIGRMTQTASEQNPEQISWVKQGIKQFEDDTHTKAVYGFAGEWATCIICEFDSAADLSQYLSLNPLGMLADWDVHPLATPSETIQTLDMVEKHVRQAA